MSSNGLTRDEKAKIKVILEQIEADPMSIEFLEPVDYIGYGLLDYPDIIKNPMDLSTIKSKISSNIYNNPQEVFNDIQLIWNNCKTYNMKGSVIF